MPYYIYDITQDPTGIARNLEYQAEFDSFQEAKKFARNRRAELGRDTDTMVKVMFAPNQLEAEERLLEKREKPIVMEWEK
ncbi:MAG TPA: hypothetical protein VK971_01405 [Thiohalobacter sp.]|nr:hypothetical protein [Thiohalobacter sp.]